MIKRIGKRTLALENRPYLLGHAAAVGKKEGEGPLGDKAILFPTLIAKFPE